MPRRFVHSRHLVGFVVFAAFVLVGGLIAKDAVTRATVGDVELAVQGGPNVDAATARRLTVAGRTLPDWSATGWRLMGGRTDRFEDDREAITGIYERAGREVSLTIVDGAAGLEDTGETSGVLDCAAGCFGGAVRPALYVKRDVGPGAGGDAATLIVIGAPVDDRTRAALQEVARAL